MGSGAAALEPRTIGGRYELDTLLGKGGIGEVWKARHIALNSQVAIKFLQGGSAVADSAKRRFAAEAQITAQLKTPNAVQVFDFGVTDEGQPYLVMELLEGETLGQRIERLGRLTSSETARLLGPCARALHRAHALGIVHRDFKPDNVIIAADHEGNEQVKVLDFGIAKLAGALDERPEPSDPALGSCASNPSFTNTGTVLGTPLYMAPEQARDAAEVDLRADIWAFGVVAFECLTGIPPFTAPTIEELFVQIYAGRHPRATDLAPGIPLAFNQWFDAACSPEREKRFASASAAWKELAHILPTDETSLRISGQPTAGDKRVLVVSGERLPADASAKTIDATRKAPSVPPLALRTQTALATLQRVTLQVPQEQGADRGATQHPPVMTSPMPPRTSGNHSRAAAAIAAAVGLLLVAGGWQLAARRTSHAATEAAGATLNPSSPPSSSSSRSPPETPSVQIAQAVPTTPPVTSALPLPSSTVTALPAPTATTLPQSRRPWAAPKPVTAPVGASEAPAAKATPSATSAAPPLPPPPPPVVATPAAPPADPGSYR